jgi:hypothetical protein
MRFKYHPDPIMGIFIDTLELRGEKQECECAFNLTENPELAEQYLAWLAEGNTPEPWEAPVADQ